MFYFLVKDENAKTNFIQVNELWFLLALLFRNIKLSSKCIGELKLLLLSVLVQFVSDLIHMLEMIKIVFEARGAVLFFRTSPGVSTPEIAKAFTFECNHLRPFGNI